MHIWYKHFRRKVLGDVTNKHANNSGNQSVKKIRPDNNNSIAIKTPINKANVAPKDSVTPAATTTKKKVASTKKVILA